MESLNNPHEFVRNSDGVNYNALSSLRVPHQEPLSFLIISKFVALGGRRQEAEGRRQKAEGRKNFSLVPLSPCLLVSLSPCLLVPLSPCPPLPACFSAFGSMPRRSLDLRLGILTIQRALEDLNPRHQVLETCVLPTELRAHSGVVFFLPYLV